ncbi:hypothetical protein V5O48_014277 [Marasmius crinis-equi]|uniref:Glutamine synthetase n=1 Tax=Marasmius crinis-equi TaxID=585013 RepID=A0ABR3EXR9_9AGAR
MSCETTDVATVPSENSGILQGARFVRLQFVDLANIVRYRIFPIKSFLAILDKGSRPRINIPKAVLGVAFLRIAEGFSAIGEYYLVLDLSTLRTLPYKPGHVSCMAFFEEKVGDESGKVEVDICPRTALKKAVERARDEGVEFLVGFEIEFILLSSTSPVVPVHKLEHYMSSLALPAGSVAETVLEEIVESLQECGIEVVMYHSEGAPGQYEIVTGPLPPLEAADALVHTRETIYGIASKHGLRATLAPNVHDDSAGSGAHVHISVHSTNPDSNSSNICSNDTLSDLEASFVSGLIDEFPALTALTLPLPSSYARVADGVWSGGTYICWGVDNREVPIRLCNPWPEKAGSRNFEVKMVDGTANPYISLAGIMTAGTDGVRNESGKTFTMKPLLDMSAIQKSEQGRAELGISEDRKIPSSWEDARKRLKESDVFRRTFGSEMIEKYLALTETMANALDEPDSEEGKRSLLVQMY